MSDSGENKWHLDKKVPLALILAIIIQTFAAGAFFARLESRVSQLEQSQVEVKDAKLPDRMTTMETSLRYIAIQINGIDVKLDRLIERRKDDR